MKQVMLMFVVAVLSFGFVAQPASAVGEDLELTLTSTLREDLPLLFDPGDGNVVDIELESQDDRNITGIEPGSCVRVWDPKGDEPKRRTDCVKTPVKFWVFCQAAGKVTCQLSPARNRDGSINWSQMTVLFQKERSSGQGGDESCPALRPSAKGSKVFGIEVDGIGCRGAKTSLKRWRGKRFTPEIGPRGWKCSITLTGRKVIRYECRKGSRTLTFSRYAF